MEIRITTKFSYAYELSGTLYKSLTTPPIRYAGYQYDSETGLYYLNARYYDSKIARFLSEDTYTGDPNDPLSLNLYTYCFNNPLIYWDPTGHISRGELYSISPSEQKCYLDNVNFAYVSEARAENTDNKEDYNTQIQIANVALTAAEDIVISHRQDSYNTEAYEEARQVIENSYKNSNDLSGKEKAEEISRLINANQWVYSEPKIGQNVPTANIFYGLADKWNAGLDDRAKLDMERWKTEMGTNAICIAILSEKQFSIEWNNMNDSQNSIQYLGLYFHSNAHNLIISAEHDEYITTNKNGITANGNNALYIGNLDKKQIENLYLYSCNSGHLDYINDNLAVSFMENQNVKNVYAWDGSMRWSNDGQYVRLANNQHHFDGDYHEGIDCH